MAAKWSGRARIAGMARAYNELLQATGNWDIAKKFTHQINELTIQAPRSLSDLTLFYCGKAGLVIFAAFPR